MNVKTDHHIPAAITPGDGTLVLDRGSVKCDDRGERFLMVARYKGARMEFRADSIGPLRELTDHLLKIGCTCVALSSDKRGAVK